MSLPQFAKICRIRLYTSESDARDHYENTSFLNIWLEMALLFFFRLVERDSSAEKKFSRVFLGK